MRKIKEIVEEKVEANKSIPIKNPEFLVWLVDEWYQSHNTLTRDNFELFKRIVERKLEEKENGKHNESDRAEVSKVS